MASYLKTDHRHMIIIEEGIGAGYPTSEQTSNNLPV